MTEDSWRVEKVGGVTGEDVDDGECCDVQGPTLDSLGWYYASIVSLLDGLERFTYFFAYFAISVAPHSHT